MGKKTKEGQNLLGLPTFKPLDNGRFKCVETGHELLAHAQDSYAQSKHCRLGLIDSALAKKKPPLNMFIQDPVSRLTGVTINKTEEHIWKHINGKRFLNILAEGNEQKKKRMKADSDITRLSPSLRNLLDSLANLKGEQVAARVSQEEAEKDEWIIVEVIHFDKETRVFEVLDEEPGDDEESSEQKQYKLPMTHIIPFPKRGDLINAQDFHLGKHVLAVYPGTTALYKATVVQTRKKKTDDYVLEFDDDEEEGCLPRREVPYHRVVPLPQGYRQ